MSAKRTKADWEGALDLLRICLAERGAKARDDRLFLEALNPFHRPHHHLAGAAGAARS